MSTEKLEKMKAKIGALLAKAEATTHTHEAESYRWKATELMQRYGVAQHEIKNESTASRDEMTTWRYPINHKGGHGYWRASCASRIAEAFGCAVVFLNVRANSKFPAIEIFGPESMIEQLKIILPLLMIHAEAGGLKAGKERRKGLYESRSFDDPKGLAQWATKYVNDARRSYLQGFGSGVGERIRNMRTDVDHSADVKGTDLALVDIHTKSTAFMNAKYEKLGTIKPKTLHDSFAYGQGYRDGKAVDTGQNNLGNSRQEIV